MITIQYDARIYLYSFDVNSGVIGLPNMVFWNYVYVQICLKMSKVMSFHSKKKIHAFGTIEW
jgi:hypothetical protein